MLANNAGTMPLSPLAALEIEEGYRTLDVNVRGVLHDIATALPAMQAQGLRHFANLGSYACYQSSPNIVAYVASKGALAQLTRTLALEAIGYGIRVSVVGSGYVVINLTKAIQPDGQAYLAEHGRAAPRKSRQLPYSWLRTRPTTSSAR